MILIDWQAIETVFLDMDGTLLDLHFDNHFWLEHVPRRYAERNGLPLEEAKRQLLERYRSVEGTLAWYCLDHWSRELGLDIVLLKQEVDHLIALHPHVLDFLAALRERGKRRVLVTNAHQKALALKLGKTQLAGHLDAIVSAHNLGLPKEDPGFWPRLHAIEPFDPERTLFVDDSPAVLRSARHYGFRWLLAVTEPDSRGGHRPAPELPAIRHFAELLPGLRATAAVGPRPQPAGGVP